MELRHLRYFVAVAEELHVGHAAERLYIGQPTLSRQIAALERELGVSLFDRAGGRMALTPAGKELLDEATLILGRVERAVESVQSISRGELGNLEIGFVGPAMWSVLPPILQEFGLRFPGVKVHVRELPIVQQLERLREGSLDIAFTRPNGLDETISTEVVWRESSVIALPAKHPHAQDEEVDLAELAGEPFILLPRRDSPALHDHFMGICADHGFVPTVVEEVSSMASIPLVAAGIGVMLLPDSVARQPWPGIVFRRLTRQTPEIQMVMAYRADRQSPVLSSFVSTARDVAPTVR